MHGCTEIKFEGQISKNGGEPVKLSASCEAETECGGVSFEESLIYVGFDAKALGFSEKGESSDDFWWKDEENEERKEVVLSPVSIMSPTTESIKSPNFD